MVRDQDRPAWKGQRPWIEAWFAVLVDESRRRALWVRQTLFVPRQGEGQARIWGAWFDADAREPTRAAKRHGGLGDMRLGQGDELIRIFDATMSRDAATGAVDQLAWDVSWTGGRDVHADVPRWLPAPSHARPIAYDAEASGTVTLDGTAIAIRGRATVMHLWGKRRVPTLQWIWAPWLDGVGLEVQAISLRDTFSLGLATLRLDPWDGGDSDRPPGAGDSDRPPDAGDSDQTAVRSIRARPASAAHASCLVTSTVAGARRLIHARAWAEPAQMVGYAYRDTNGRDLMVAQSDIGSAQLEIYTRTAPGVPWKLADDRRVAGGVVVEIHQHAPLPDVEYIAWDATTRAPHDVATPVIGNEDLEWPEVTAVVALGLTYGDHVRETGQKLDPKAPPVSFVKHARALTPGDGGVRVPSSQDLLAALDELDPGVAAALREKLPHVPAVMDYEGELAVVALGPIDDVALAAGTAQPLGVAAANDLTARFCQVLGETTEDPLAYWTCAKSFPGFLPVAPRVWAPAGGLARLPDLTLETRVNGMVRQHASTKLVIYDLATMLRAARERLGRPLGRGDVVLTGTPAGVGLRMSPIKRRVAALIKDRFRKAELLISSYATSSALLRPGDVVEVDAGPAGRVRTRLVV